MLVLPVLVVPAVFTACSSDTGPPLTTATSLSCPAPGALPFRLSSTGFQKSANQSIATDNPRNKDQASDTVGNVGGPMASVYLDDAQPAAATAVDYHGVKALTAADNGISDTPLAGENVSLWAYDATGKWHSLGQTTTDTNGVYDLPSTGYVATNAQPVYAMLEATGSCAEHFDYLYKPMEQVVVTDIDGTLTASDAELGKQLINDADLPAIMGAADKLMAAWSKKGYPIIYLTARPHLLRAETRTWLDGIGFPPGALITENGGEAGDDVYKTLWLQRMVQTFGWKIVAAYGNADTDITAYMNAGIPQTQIFIVGPLAGSRGTMPIQGNDFTDHIATYVSVQPPNG